MWSEWAGPVAPDMGVKVVEFMPSKLCARIQWFRPILNASGGRRVERYELQVCHLKGPLITSIRVLKSKAFLLPKTNEENFTSSYLRELEEKQKKIEEEEEQSRQLSDTGNETNVNEYVTVRDDLIEECFEVAMHAGAKYQCRVRPKITGDEDFCPWEMSVMSETFSLAATLPDPPFDITPAPHSKVDISAIAEKENEANSTAEAICNNLSNEKTKLSRALEWSSKNSIDEVISAVTNSGIMPMKVDPKSELVEKLREKDRDDNRKAASISYQITHDTIIITWKNGNCHGLPAIEFEVQWAKVRDYVYEEISLAKEARGHIGEEAYEFEQSLSVFDDEEAREEAQVGSSNGALVWCSSMDESNKKGKFISGQLFKLSGLLPGAHFIFRMRQRNQLGWSKFSAASEMIQTFPARPPSQPEFVSAGTTFVIVRWSEGSKEAVGFTNLDFEVEISAIDVATIPKGNDSNLEDVYENCPLNWYSADVTRCDSTGSIDLSAVKFITAMIRRLVPGCTYIARVRVHTLHGWSTWSDASKILSTLH